MKRKFVLAVMGLADGKQNAVMVLVDALVKVNRWIWVHAMFVVVPVKCQKESPSILRPILRRYEDFALLDQAPQLVYGRGKALV